MDKFQYDVFISYCHCDIKVAKKLVDRLRGVKLSVWFDSDCIKPGTNWIFEAENAVKQSRHFVILIGEEGASPWLQGELNLLSASRLYERGSRIIPVLCPGGEPSKIPHNFNPSRFVDLRSWNERIVNGLIDALTNESNGGTMPDGLLRQSSNKSTSDRKKSGKARSETRQIVREGTMLWPRRFDVGIQVVIGPELQCVLKHFDIDSDRNTKSRDGALFYFGSILSKKTNSKLSIVVHCQDRAGNEASASAAEKIIGNCKPRSMFLLGIAAGRRGKCKIGDVVIPRIVVDNTQGVVKEGKIMPRTRTMEPPYPMLQQLKSYQLNLDEWYRRLSNAMQPPSPLAGEEEEYQQNVAARPECHEAGIYSSDLLLRDPNVLKDQSERVNEQIRIGEMEAAGFGTACNSRSKPIPWYIVRGVSDFGDAFKNDTFQRWASQSASAYLRVMIENGLRIELLK